MSEREQVELITEILFEEFEEEQHFSEAMSVMTSYNSPEITHLMMFSLLLGTITPKEITDAYYSSRDFGEVTTEKIQTNTRRLVDYIKRINVEVEDNAGISLEKALDVISENIENNGVLLFDDSKDKYFSRVTDLMVSPKASKNIMLQRKNNSMEQLYLKAVYQMKDEIKGGKLYESTTGIYRRMIDSLLDVSYINNINSYIGSSSIYMSGSKRSIFNRDIDRCIVANRNNTLFILNDSLLDNAATLFVFTLMSIVTSRIENITLENSEEVREEISLFRNIILDPYVHFSNEKNLTFLTNTVSRKNSEGKMEEFEENSILEYIESFMDHDKNILIPMTSPGMFFLLTYYIIPEFVDGSTFDVENFRDKIIKFLGDLKDQTKTITTLIYNIQERVLSYSRSFEVIL